MGTLHRTGAIETDEDAAFQRREWAAQRAGWAALLALVAAGALGAFGGGPFARAEADAGPLQIRYERFARWSAPTTFEAALAPADTAALWFSDGLLEGLRVESVFPEPAETRSEAGGVLFQFAGAPRVVRIVAEPLRPGVLSGTVRAGGAAAEVRLIVFP